MSYADLAKRKKENFAKLQTKLKSTASGKSSFTNQETLEEGYWQPTADTTKSGWAVIRFMPGPPSDDGPNPEDKGCALPWALLYTHSFKGPGGWYIENCLTTLSTKDNPVADPAVEYSTQVWGPNKQAKSQAAKDRVSGTSGNPGTKRKTNYYSNIYVVNDPAVPANNGKVFRYKYGPRIFEFLNEAMNPSTDDEEAWDPFDLLSGGNFKIKFRPKDGHRNYGSSTWETKREPLFDTIEKTDALYNSLRSLKEIVDPSNFKSYNVLKSRLMKVLGPASDASSQNVEPVREVYRSNTVEDQAAEVPPWEEVGAMTKTRAPVNKVQPVEEPETSEDNNLAFFESLRDK